MQKAGFLTTRLISSVSDCRLIYGANKIIIVHMNPGRFGPGSFRPNFGVGRFGLGRWVDSALGRFGPGSFRPKSIPKCRLLRTGRQTNR